jgi:uncharacterized protein YutE (UPF0331/DUF86 family)
MSPDRRKLRQKVHYVREAVAALERIRSEGRAAFLSDPLKEPAATRWLQVAIEAMLDAAHHIIAREGWGLPKSYREAVDLLVEHEVLPAASKPRFHAMVAFRNRAVHLYDDIQPEQVFSMLERDLGDFELFLVAVSDRYLTADERDGGC